MLSSSERPRARQRREVSLPFEALCRLERGSPRLVRPAGSREHVGQVEERVALRVQEIRAADQLDRLTDRAFRRFVLAAASARPRPT